MSNFKYKDCKNCTEHIDFDMHYMKKSLSSKAYELPSNLSPKDLSQYIKDLRKSRKLKKK